MIRDEGLQAERTLLAWGRTLLSMLGAGLLLLRWLPSHGVASLGLIGMCLSVALLIWIDQKRRYRHRLEAIEAQRLAADPWAVLGLGAMVSLLACGALLLVI